MKHTYRFIISILLTSVLFFGCKKYEEGPKFITLRTVKARLTNGDWKLQELSRDNAIVTDSYKEIDFKYTFDANGSIAKSASYTQDFTYLGQLNKVSGSVSFLKEDELVLTLESYSSYGYYPPVFSYDQNDIAPIWKIKKLSNKEFWMETTIEGQVWYMKLTKSK